MRARGGGATIGDVASDGGYAGRLSGKVCIVTGTGASMGRATALAFAREGASVVGCDVTGVDIVVDGGMKVW